MSRNYRNLKQIIALCRLLIISIVLMVLSFSVLYTNSLSSKEQDGSECLTINDSNTLSHDGVVVIENANLGCVGKVPNPYEGYIVLLLRISAIISATGSIVLSVVLITRVKNFK